MDNNRVIIFSALCFLYLLINSCKKDNLEEVSSDFDGVDYRPKSQVIEYPKSFGLMKIPSDNPTTEAGVRLGRNLFYDPILSSDSTKSCFSCHFIEASFSDNEAKAKGIKNLVGRRSSMSLLNVAFSKNGFFWDGRANTLEEQALFPVEDPLELSDTWDNVMLKLKRHKQYPILFRQAFGINSKEEMTKELVAKALAQFERTIVSTGKAKWDRVQEGTTVFNDSEKRGYEIFFDINSDTTRHAECGHCHNEPFFQVNEYLNNGITKATNFSSFIDPGRGKITLNALDTGRFKVVSLRNIFKSAPYMHDGRFKTIDDVLNHYHSGGNIFINSSSILRILSLNAQDIVDIKAFLHTLDEPDLEMRKELQNPFK